MAQVTLPYNLTPGTPENVNNLMSNLNALKDGVNTIDTAQIANGAVTAAKLATAVSSGLATNVKSTFKDDIFSTTSTSFTDITGMSVSITPTANTSKVLVIAHVYVAAGSNNTHSVNLLRGSTNIAQPATGTTTATMNAQFDAAERDKIVSIAYLDSPATTSATTYKLQSKSSNGGTVYVNRRGDSANVTSVSNITAIEVLA